MPEHPNVLLICTDHFPHSALGISGHPTLQTPTLDQIADNGIRFTNCYTECPTCVPARRTLMTGLTPRTHGMQQNDNMPLPEVSTMAQAFRDQGYQAMAVGKLHVFPQRDRIGFDDVILDEEGRGSVGIGYDDYELFLADQGHAGQRFAGGMNNNEYVWRSWHLPEHTHVTNWTTQQMCRTIKRRDPRKPSFWYLSYSHPHPPLAPLQAYLDFYDDFEIDAPYAGDWSQAEDRPTWVKTRQNAKRPWNAAQIRAIRKAYYALITQIDHQLRLVIGTLREEGLLNDTIIMFTADHGELLGNHGLWAKSAMYEDAANIPMLIQDRVGGRIEPGQVSHNLVGLRDVMPTLLDLCGLPIPEHCEGQSMLAPSRERIYSECGYADRTPMATRMVRDHRYKLIYYPAGNVRQFFDLQEDPRECRDLADSPDHQDDLARLTTYLIQEFEDDRGDYIRAGHLVGLEDPGFSGRGADRAFSGQRGTHLPPPVKR